MQRHSVFTVDVLEFLVEWGDPPIFSIICSANIYFIASCMPGTMLGTKDPVMKKTKPSETKTESMSVWRLVMEIEINEICKYIKLVNTVTEKSRELKAYL